MHADREVDAEEEAPQLALGPRGAGEGLDDANLAARHALLPLALDAVERVPLDRPVQLERSVELAARAAPPALRVGELVLLPPVLRARDQAGARRADPVVHGREELVRLLGVDEPDAAVGAVVVAEREAGLVGLHAQRRHGQAVAEAAVDLRLRRPERRDRLAPAVDVLELAAHEVAQDPAAPMGRQHADPRHAGTGQLATRDRQAELVGGREADRSAVVVGRQRAFGGEGVHLALPVLVAQRIAEGGLGGLHRGAKLVRRGRPDLDGHQAIFSRGA